MVNLTNTSVAVYSYIYISTILKSFQQLIVAILFVLFYLNLEIIGFSSIISQIFFVSNGNE